MAEKTRLSWRSSCSALSTVPSTFRSLIAGLLVVPGLLLFSTPAHATPLTVTVGTFSFDQFLPAADTTPGVNAFDILNLTDLGLDLDGSGVIAPALNFLNLAATFVDEGGTAGAPITLGDLAANSLLADSTGVSPLLFADTQFFASAVLTGMIEGFTAQLADGSVFTAALSPFTVTILPLSGTTLAAGVDLASITITGDVSTPTSEVPEPGTLLLLAMGIVALGAGARARRRTARAQ
jgi:hypothetical protein